MRPGQLGKLISDKIDELFLIYEAVLEVLEEETGQPVELQAAFDALVEELELDYVSAGLLLDRLLEDERYAEGGDDDDEDFESVDEAILNQNAQGQGYSEEHKAHHLHDVATKAGYAYSHSTPVVQRDGSTQVWHTWKKGDHNVGAYHGSNDWTIHKGGSGHRHVGHGAEELARHLKSRNRRVHEETESGEAVLNEAQMARYVNAIRRTSTRLPRC